jgi:hypothetical protein
VDHIQVIKSKFDETDEGLPVKTLIVIHEFTHEALATDSANLPEREERWPALIRYANLLAHQGFCNWKMHQSSLRLLCVIGATNKTFRRSGTTLGIMANRSKPIL